MITVRLQNLLEQWEATVEEEVELFGKYGYL